MREKLVRGEVVPVYEYECGLCRLHFERRQRFDAESAAICPRCQGKARRVFHSIPIIFKGSGFYTTDNRKSVVEEAGKKEPGKKQRKGK